LKQAVGEVAPYAPASVRRTLRPRSSPYTPYACGAQRALLPVAEGAMNIHDVRDRQTSDRQTDVRQHHRLMPRLGGGGIINERWIRNHCDFHYLLFVANFSTAVLSSMWIKLGLSVQSWQSWLFLGCFSGCSACACLIRLHLY